MPGRFAAGGPCGYVTVTVNCRYINTKEICKILTNTLIIVTAQITGIAKFSLILAIRYK